MKQCPRRAVLGGIGATTIAGLVGTTVATSDDENVATESATTQSARTGPTFDDAFAYLPASVAEDQMAVTARNYERLLEADQPYEPRPSVGALEIDPDAVSKSVLVASYGESFSRPMQLFTGDIDLEDRTESGETDAGVEYDYYETDDREGTAVGTDGDVVIVATDLETIESAFDANAGDADRLLDSEETVEEALTVFEGGDARTVRFGDDLFAQSPIEDADARYFVHAQTVLGPDTIEMSLGIQFEDESDVTDELIETIDAEFAYATTTAEPTVDVAGSFVSATIERDLAAERKIHEHDSPGSLRPDRDIDLDDDVLELEIGRGDPTPIEDLTLEINEEAYDRDIWAEGHGTLEEGDTIVIDMDDVEPNLSVRLRHDHELGSSTSGTAILSHFRFDSAYDVDTGELALTYADDFPLDGDRVHLAVYDERPYYRPSEDAPEPQTTAQPWTGEALSEGDAVTLEDVDPGDEILVGWDGTEYDDSIGHAQAQPPGTARFEYDYGSRTLEATLEFGGSRRGDAAAETERGEAERPATAYELLIDGEPTDTQWADAFDTVSSGATIEIDGVSAGSEVEVVWAATETRIGWTQTRPSVELEYDDGTVEHVGGDALPAADLEAEVWTNGGRIELDLDDEIDGDFERGDSFAIDAGTDDEDDGGEVRYVQLRYDDQYHVGFAHSEQ
ncbi:hypothetical protein [Natronorubrum halophilum]|uniref:hypothetical protein n=1 Tax=Natronorubrum halophilum TaxID=1702106 RepID=UPI000EF69101|nr:hypothetical protein [Natronorubrum halophilum]